MTIQRADPTQIALQQQISEAVIQRVADQATYTINFRGQRPITAISAKGAESLYEQCVAKDLCPEISLEKAFDHIQGGQWIVDGVWRAIWKNTGETFTIEARGSEPYDGPASDPMSVANRKAMGKARRNAHLSAVPSVIREAFLDHLKNVTGREVVHSEEYVPTQRPDAEEKRPRTTRGKGRQVSSPSDAGGRTKQPHELVYEYAKSIGLDPAGNVGDIYMALGEMSVPNFLDAGNTVEDAQFLLNKHLGPEGDWANSVPSEEVVEEDVVVEEPQLFEGDSEDEQKSS